MKNHDWSLSGIAFAGCLFIGMGLGILLNIPGREL